MSTDSERRKYAEKIAREWAEKGKAMEGGWRAYRALMLPADMQRIIELPAAGAPDAMEAAFRKVFYLGAQHLWATVFGSMDPGTQETAGDMRRMTNMHTELEAFTLELANQHKPGHG